MGIFKVVCKLNCWLERIMVRLSPLVDLVVRLWVAEVFIRSGLSKLQAWDSTLMLFQYEYSVPFLSPEWAAYLGTGAELVLPVLLAIGLGGRLPALGLFFFNVVAVLAYDFLFTVEGQAGLNMHIFWGFMLLVLSAHGTGKLSLDNFLRKRCCSAKCD